MHSVNFIQLTPMGLGKQTEIEIIDKKHLKRQNCYLFVDYPAPFYYWLNLAFRFHITGPMVVVYIFMLLS